MRCKLFRLGAIAVLMAPLSGAGTLRVGVPQVEGNRVVLPVLLEGDAAGGVAALDFTLNYDPVVFTPVGAEASAAAQAARKQVESNEVSPGNYVVMMFGMNQTTVDNGPIASITLSKKVQPASNQSDVSIAQTTFASVEGQEIASEGSSQTVTFPPPPSDDNGDGDPTPPGETPPPAQPPSETPDPAPGPPVTTPDASVPSVPGVPGGTPQQPDRPAEDTPRATPMVIATSGVGERTAQAAQVGGVARMNRAAQQLENSRAALGPSARIGDSAPHPEDADEDSDPDRENATAPTAKSQSTSETRDEMKVAAAPGTDPQLTAGSARAASSAANDARDSSGIPPSSRRILIVVASVVAVSLVVYRFARRPAR